MNLKLIRGHYKDMKDEFNYDLFGEYMKIIGRKKVFKGGFGNVNVQVNNIKSNRKRFTPIQSHEHKYQINIIIKRFNETLRQKAIERAKNNDTQSRNSLISKKRSLLRPMSLIGLNANPIQFGNTGLFSKSKSSSNFNIVSPLSSNKDNGSSREWFNGRKTSTQMKSPSGSASTRFMKDPFIDFNEEKYLFDRSHIRKGLEKNYNFYQMDKLILKKLSPSYNCFEENEGILLKRSLLRINSIRRKEKSSTVNPYSNTKVNPYKSI